jgi:hypothetical protein
VSAFEN